MLQARKTAGALLGALVVGLFSVMLTLVFVQVVNRYLLGLQIFWTEEVIRLLLVWSVMLAVPLVSLRHMEISVELGPMSGSGLVRLRRAAIGACSALFCAVLAWQGYLFYLRNLPAMSPTLGLSRGWFVAPIPLGAALTMLAVLIRPQRDADASADGKESL